MADTPEDLRTATIERIAQEVLGVSTLEARHADALDFHELAVWQLREALLAAYFAGRESGNNSPGDPR